MSLRIKNLEMAEAFGPFRIYHFSRGLTLDIGAKEACLRGGPRLCKIYGVPELSGTPDIPDLEWLPSADTYAALIEQIETEIGVRAVASASKFPQLTPGYERTPPISKPNGVCPPDVAIFKVGNRNIRAGELGEELLGRFQSLEFYSHVLTSNRADGDFDRLTLEICANLKEGIWSGHLGPAELSRLIEKARAKGHPIEEAFFLFNIDRLADSIRSAMSRACYHFSNMTEVLWRANQIDITNGHLKSITGTTDGPREIWTSSQDMDRVADEFTSSVIACYSTLDLLYELFVYLTREPFGRPDYPRRLHFPDTNPQVALRNGAVTLPDDLSSADAPLAIPNLPANRFTSLRRLRNDLVHNMTADELRARVYTGIGLSPVNGQELQYAMYMTRDVEMDGRPVLQPWSRCFYQQQRDAQHILHDWLIDTWQCVFDTTEWLTNRLFHRTCEAGLCSHTVG